MWILSSKIKIGSFVFNQVKEVAINRTLTAIGDTATLQLPLKAVLKNGTNISLENAIKRGDDITIELGYDNKLSIEFKGYVKSIKAKESITIECEDNIYKLRKTLINKSWPKTNLKEVMQYVADQTGIELSAELPEVTFDTGFLIKDATGAVVMQKIKDEYGLSIYFDLEGKLFAGLLYTYKTGEVNYNLQKNVISNDLIWKDEDERKFKIKAVSMTKDNKKITKETGDPDGDLRTLTFYNITDEAKLVELANNEIKKYKYTGFEGNLTTFLLPQVMPGMTANITDKETNKGRYYVQSVKTTFGSGGARRVPELGIKLNV